MANKTSKINKAQTPATNKFGDGSLGYTPPDFDLGMTYRTLGSSGLRQYGGWMLEEFLQQLQGRNAARTFREMRDNSSTVGAILFAITQSLRSAELRVIPADQTPASIEAASWVESLKTDMAQSWQDFIMDALSMLPFGYSLLEMVFKRRQGRPTTDPSTPSSKYTDNTIGIHRLPLRGQDTIIKWFFDDNGQILGFTQQPWIGPMIDIPIQKCLHFRPSAFKNNPEGMSILRTAYRNYIFKKRLEEQQAICFERMSGMPVLYLPNALIEAAGTDDAKARATLEMYKRIITNFRIDEQMGGLFPSDPYRNSDGTISNQKMFDFRFEAPNGRVGPEFEAAIERNKLEILQSVLGDFIALGHSTRGTQTLSVSKIDLFNEAVYGFLDSIAQELNNKLLPLLWEVNAFPQNTMPSFNPDMPTRTDLDGLSNFLLRLAQAGFPLAADPASMAYLRDIAGLPDSTEDDTSAADDNTNDLDTDTDPAAPPSPALPSQRSGVKPPQYLTRAQKRRKK